MLKIVQCAALLFLILFQVGCNNQPSKKDPRIAQVNEWYGLQTEYTQISPDSVVKYAHLIDSVAKDLPPVYKAMALVGKGRSQPVNKPDLAMKLYEQALELLKGTGADSVTARVYNGIGVRYIQKSDYSNALDNYFKALRLFEKAKDPKGMGGVMANIGEVYQVKGDIPSAKKYILRSMETSKQSGNMHAYLDAAQTLANIYGMNNQFDSAIAIDRMGIEAAHALNSNKLTSAFYNNLGNCYMYGGRPDSARYYFMQCLVLDSAMGLPHYMVDNYVTLGQLSLQLEQLDNSEQYFRRAIHLSDSIRENRLKLNAWKALSTLYGKKNDLAKVIVAQDSMAAIKDRVINERSENKIAELQELYETEKKEQTIALQQVKLSRQRLMLLGGVILFASLLLSAWLFYRRYKIKKEKEMHYSLMKQREQATLDILQAEEQERRRIAAELHDGVGQVMLAAWMNLQAIEPQIQLLESSQQQALTKAIAMVGEGCKEVREVSHSMMPNALLNKGLVGAVRDFTQQIDKKVLSISLHTEGLDEPMEEMVETIVYRVIQESVNNTIRHSGARELDISIHNTKEGISLLIEDNGKGFDTNKMLHLNDGLGLQNIKRRIAFLNGTAEWDSSPGNGTLVTIFIPAKKAA